MRYITIPSSTQIPTSQGPKAYAFSTFVSEFVLNDPRWRKDWAEYFFATHAALCEATEGAVVEMTTEDHERVYQCAMAAQPGAMFLFSVMPHIHAITLAK